MKTSIFEQILFELDILPCLLLQDLHENQEWKQNN